MNPHPNIQLQRTIGTGTFGKVKRAIYKPTGQALAVKILNKQKIASKTDHLRIEKQISILKKINHPNLLRLYQLIVSPKHYYLVTQLAQGQQLYQRINRKGHLPQQQAGLLFVQLLDGVMHLKSKGIAHRDIKPENIIVQGHRLTLIDYGLGGIYQQGQKLTSSCGSHCYAAPQMMNGKAYNPEKTQVWALGITLYAMLSGNLPFQHDNPSDLLKIMLKNKYEPISNISSALQQLLRLMIEAKPSKRISLKEIKNHKWIKAMQHQFVQHSQVTQWNNEIIKELSYEKSIKQQQMKVMIQQQFGEETIAYHLRNQQVKAQFSLHSGPIHLKYLFKSLDLAKNYINQQKQCKWLSKTQALSQTHKLEIKQVKGNFYYVFIQPL